jgi:hypothetical protein
MKQILSLVILGLIAAPVSAVTLDGSIAGDGYVLRSVQTVETQFGDNLSELNAAYSKIEGGVLYLALTGQVENNFNKLNIFIDTGAGGQNAIGPDTANGGLNPTNDGWAQKYRGFTFDSGFDANYLIIARNGNFGGDRFDFDFNSVGNAGTVQSTFDIFGGSLTGANASVGAAGIGVAYDNSNVAGVLGGTAAADSTAAKAVQTGLELAIPLSALGNPNPANILISAHVNASNHDYLSNQSLGGFPAPQGNLGSDGTGAGNGNVAGINLNQYPGNQYFPVVPEPTAAVLGVLAVAGVAVRRRK